MARCSQPSMDQVCVLFHFSLFVQYVCNVNTILVMCLWSCGMLLTGMQVLFGGAEGGDNLCFGLKDYVVLIRLSCNKGKYL